MSTANINCFSGSRCLVRAFEVLRWQNNVWHQEPIDYELAVDIWRSCVSADCWRLDTQVMAAKSREDFLNP